MPGLGLAGPGVSRTALTGSRTQRGVGLGRSKALFSEAHSGKCLPGGVRPINARYGRDAVQCRSREEAVRAGVHTDQRRGAGGVSRKESGRCSAAPFPPSCPSHAAHSSWVAATAFAGRVSRAPRAARASSGSQASPASAAEEEEEEEEEVEGCRPASAATNLVLAFYDAVNRRDMEAAMECIADECVYEDLIYPQPFVGRAAIEQHFRRVLDVFPSDVVFAVDDVSRSGADLAVGMTWHADLNGKSLPFSRGCSFYRCAEFPSDESSPGSSTTLTKLKIIYGRDIPEPTFKPGNAALSLLGFAVALLRRLP